MDFKTINCWIMYHKIQKMHREGFSYAKIASCLQIDARSVRKYCSLSEEDYTRLLADKRDRKRLLEDYEPFIKEKLDYLPSISAAQMHDWLKEHHPDFPLSNPRTVYNFVMWVRQKYQIPVEEKAREYFAVADFPYGAQGQGDFGQYWLRASEGRKKVYFFTTVLSRSRMKYVYFSTHPFTTGMVIDAHEEAFRYFEGIPGEMVYDQDRLLLVDENLGDLLLTRDFRDYVQERGFKLFFCRRSDPQSKGKIENVVKYIKQNFLYGRVFYDIDTLQTQAMGWLSRTGNAMIHSTTLKIPAREWEIEKTHLSAWAPITRTMEWISCTVLKTHVFYYQGNRYSVPQGTYTRKGTQIKVLDRGNQLDIYDLAGQLLCEHDIPLGKGNTVINTHHRRDKSMKIRELLEQTVTLFPQAERARQFLGTLYLQKPRYVRDQLLKIRDMLPGYDPSVVSLALAECLEQNLYEATAFCRSLEHHQQDRLHSLTPAGGPIQLLDPGSMERAQIQPASSDINLYENLFNLPQ